ncbi:M20/M25/M40 family metallo-hydrolase [Brevibacterium sp. 50QC2O2]|uniref:M20 family metallopeptidase n=1 Tax=Brevibacterium sp. 50QC2O2 TaxID=2968459 RepID=UPI00211B9E9C|nr:M20/M25/M40 family metallo-hydrolase [Brevibacterium sp. 50QC2O2]MCQ9389887.1 M20/M25/M40 family metallo-hydrolase [Brevibacterium sp. 50QC2O2]
MSTPETPHTSPTTSPHTPPSTSAAAQGEWERRILAELDRRAPELLELAGDLIRIPSENPAGDCSAVAAFTAGWLNEHGIEARIHAVDDVPDAGPGRVNVVARLRPEHLPAEAPGAATADAAVPDTATSAPSPAGTPAPRHLALAGHYDVVPIGDTERWDFPPLAGDVVDGYLRGRGASDMKAGLAGQMLSMVVLRDLGVPLAGPITFAAVCDEETGGVTGSPWVLEHGMLDGVTGAAIAEPAERGFPTIGQKGLNKLRITIDGAPGHGSLQPLHGTSANLLAARAVLALQDLWKMAAEPPESVRLLIADSVDYAEARTGDGPGAYRPGISQVFSHVTVNIGTLHGGTGVNVVADRAVLEVDTRIPIGLCRADVNARVIELLAEVGVHVAGGETGAGEHVPAGGHAPNARIEVAAQASEANWTDKDDPIVVELVGALREVVGPESKGVLQWASSDARFFRAHGIPVLQYGPAELPCVHGFNERCRVADVVDAAKVFALTAVRYLGLAGA